MRPSDTVLRRVMRCRRKGSGPQQSSITSRLTTVLNSKRLKHIAELGFDTRLSQAVPSPSMCQSILSDDLAGRQGITREVHERDPHRGIIRKPISNLAHRLTTPPVRRNKAADREQT